MKQEIINRLPFNPINIDNAIIELSQYIKTKTPGYIVFTGVNDIIISREDKEFKEKVCSAILSLPDGMPIIWLLKKRGFSNLQRCAGPDFFLECMRKSTKNNWSHYFFGGKEGVAIKLKEKMLKQFPGLRVVGTFTPPFREIDKKEEKEIIKDFEKKKPDIIWVGLGTPKQQYFMYRFSKKYINGIFIGVGAAFDFHAGIIKRAPKTIQNIGLEWLYRTIQDPIRLIPRYSIIVPKFLTLAVFNYYKKRFNNKQF